MEKKREKAGLPPQKITNQAHQSAKNINKIEKGSSNTNVETRAKKVEEAYKDAANAKPGSITAKANLVKAFDERNKKEVVRNGGVGHGGLYPVFSENKE